MMQRHRIAVLGLLMALAISACGSVPQPFRPSSDQPPNELIRLGPETAGIEVDLIRGTTLPMAALISTYVSDAFLDRDIPAAPAPSLRRGFILTGYATRNTTDASIPYVIQIHWTLKNRDGTTVGTHLQGITGPYVDWENGSERVLVEAADGTAASISRLILGASADIIEGKTVEGIWVGPVRGAPGDGNTALRRALRLALKGQGQTLHDTAPEAAARILGRVNLSEVNETTENIAIVWEVLRPDGTTVGKASQENAIPKGSLNGPWGQVAAYATAAVVSAVIELTDRIGAVGIPKKSATPN